MRASHRRQLWGQLAWRAPALHLGQAENIQHRGKEHRAQVCESEVLINMAKSDERHLSISSRQPIVPLRVQQGQRLFCCDVIN